MSSPRVNVAFDALYLFFLFLDESADVEVQFDASVLNQGVYGAVLVVTTNDANRLKTKIPLELRVFCGRLSPEALNRDAPILTQIDLRRSQTETSDIYTLEGVVKFPTPLLNLHSRKSSFLPQSLSIRGAVYSN